LAKYIISYDLRKPDFDYQPLYDALDEIGATHLQDSVWGVDSKDKAKVVYEYLWQHMHGKQDRLFVVAFDRTNYHSINAIDGNKLASI